MSRSSCHAAPTRPQASVRSNSLKDPEALASDADLEAARALPGRPFDAGWQDAFARSLVCEALKKLSDGPHRLLICVWSASAWMNRARNPTPEGRRHAAANRDAAIARVRRASTATLAVATALVAAF